ncbi:hypothetical protein ACETAC_01705 [Aceticella autotrophica]|uniref:Uncharacterized protein n=1 Tax=Aceticella autotrophica TaxID=2755338 RepID=A0A975AWB6_9THEO|nr:DUF5693 family protein [Aceticella autotrophica]QSZ27644.1 hypothetical protein ACETAC_01705 [Aceticella autotrophica]
MKLKVMLVAVIILSVIVSIYVDVARIGVENKYDTVEIVADLYNFENLSANTGNDISNILKEMKANGLKGVAVPEVSLKRLRDTGKISLNTMSDVQNIYTLIGKTDNEAVTQYLRNITDRQKEIQCNFLIVTTRDRDTFDFLKNSLSRRVPQDKLTILEKNKDYAFIINEPMDTFSDQGLGFDVKDLNMVKALGFDVIPRVENFNGIKDRDIENYIKLLKNYDTKTVIFGGNDVLGNMEKISYAASQFKKNGITVGIIDTPMGKKLQSGIEKFTKFDGYRGLKVYGLSEKETQKYDINDIVDRWYRSIIERNVRIIYMRAKVDDLKTPAYNMKQNITAMKQLNTLVDYAGLKTGIAKPMGVIHQSKIIEVLIAVGVVAGGILLLLSFGLKEVPALILTIATTVLTAAVLLTRFNDLGIKTVALAASIIFPSLGIVYFVNSSNGLINNKEQKGFISVSLKIFIKAVLISFVGGLMIAAIMADSKYMLKLDYFRGVKLSFTIPVLIFAIYYCYKVFKIDNFKKFINTSVKILNMDIKIWHMLAAAAAALICIIYISRTGNSPLIKPSSIELKFRDFLEHYLVARPRTKEFLFGYPALILAVYAAIKKSKGWNFILGIFASIGILSAPNTMSHVESVLTMAIERTVYGWIFGAIIGVIAVVIIERLVRFANNLLKRGALL